MPEGERQEPIDLGPKYVGPVRLTDITILRQTRTDFDPVALEELATSIVDDPTIAEHPEDATSESFDLTTPIIVGVHDYFSAAAYIKDHAEHYGVAPEERMTPEDLVWRDDGTTVILVDGERRTRSMFELARRFDIDPARLRPMAATHHNISFAVAQRRQLKANVNARPSPQEEARSIALVYRDVVRETGKDPRMAFFAASVGFSETKVRDALAFDSLPTEIQDLLTTQNLSFTVVRRFKQIAVAYDRLYDNRHEVINEEERALLTKEALLGEAQRLLKDMLHAKDQKRGFDPGVWVENRAREVNNEAEYQAELFFIESTGVSARRTESAHLLSQQAIRALEYQAKIGDMRPETLLRIQEIHASIGELIQRAKDIAESRVELDIFADVKSDETVQDVWGAPFNSRPWQEPLP